MQSTEIGKLALALSKAQRAVKIAVKDANNPFFKSQYADLGSVWNACREALTDNEMAVSQHADGDTAETMALVTTLMHSSGQWIQGKYPIKPTKADPQGIGSAITYARRYSLAAMVGIVSDVDDDGEAASGRAKAAPKTTSTGEVKQKKPDWLPDQKAEAGALRVDIMALGGEERFNLLWKRMAYDDASAVIDALGALKRELEDIADQAKGN